MPAPMCPDKPFHTWRATCLLFLHLGARTSPVPPTYRATCLLFLHLSAQTSPVATQRAVCFTFLHPCAQTSPVTTQRAACLEFTACTMYSTLEKTGECKRKPGVGDSVCVIESFQPCDCWCYLLVLLLINLETCRTTRLNVHIRSKEFRNSWTQRFSVFQNFRNMYFWD